MDDKDNEILKLNSTKSQFLSVSLSSDFDYTLITITLAYVCSRRFSLRLQ